MRSLRIYHAPAANLRGGFFFAPDVQCCYFYESACLFYLRLNFDFYVSKIMHLHV